MVKIKRIFLPKLTSKSFTVHRATAGKSGSGKSNAEEFRVIQEVGKKKVVDLYDSGRFENCMYVFKEENPYKCKLLRDLTNGTILPHPTPAELIFISGRGLEYSSNLPGNKDGEGVFLKAFQESDLTVQDVTYLLGKSDALRGLLDYIANKSGSDEISFDNIYSFLKGQRKMRQIPFYMIESVIRYIIRWKMSGMFSKGVDDISIEKSLNEKDKITSYSTFLLEPDEEPIAYGLILKKIWELKKKRKIHHRIRIYVREIANFFEEGWELPRRYLLRIQREGRDYGLDVAVDTQRPGDLPPKYRRQFGYYSQMKADYADAEKVLEIQEVPKKFLEKIPNFDVGQSLLATGMRWDQPVITPPTPHMHKEPWFDVLTMLKQKYGSIEYDVDKILEYEEPEEMETKDEGSTQEEAD